MKLKSGVVPTALHQLHEDCLLEIFKYLNLREQYHLWQLHIQFKNVMLILWKRKYRRTIDFHAESQLKLLTDEECEELLGMLLHCTKEVIADEFIGHQLNALNTKRETFSNISKISINLKSLSHPPRRKQGQQSKCIAHIAEIFPQLESLHLKHLRISLNQLTTLSNLNDLRLLLCTSPSNFIDFEGIFRNLRLKTFAFMASTSAGTTHTNSQPHCSLQSIKYCTTLQILQIHANDLIAALADVIQLPRLQQLTIFTAGNTTTHSNMTAAQLRIVAALRHIKAAQIVGVQFSCHFDWRILQQLHALQNLRTFRWRSHLQVDYIDDGQIKWQSYDPRVSREILKMVNTCRNLKELDLRGNCHVTKEFICRVWQALQARPNDGGEVQLKLDQDGKARGGDSKKMPANNPNARSFVETRSGRGGFQGQEVQPFQGTPSSGRPTRSMNRNSNCCTEPIDRGRFAATPRDERMGNYIAGPQQSGGMQARATHCPQAGRECAPNTSSGAIRGQPMVRTRSGSNMLSSTTMDHSVARGRRRKPNFNIYCDPTLNYEQHTQLDDSEPQLTGRAFNLDDLRRMQNPSAVRFNSTLDSTGLNDTHDMPGYSMFSSPQGRSTGTFNQVEQHESQHESHHESQHQQRPMGSDSEPGLTPRCTPTAGAHSLPMGRRFEFEFLDDSHRDIEGRQNTLDDSLDYEQFLQGDYGLRALGPERNQVHPEECGERQMVLGQSQRNVRYQIESQLVKDEYCPGVIQDTVDGNHNFNELALDVILGPKSDLPSHPPVDFITLLEAFHLRIELEKDQVEMHHVNNEPVSVGTNALTRHIDKHFSQQYHSDLNKAIASLLKAEAIEEHFNPTQTAAFMVDIQKGEIDLLGVTIYTGTTKPKGPH